MTGVFVTFRYVTEFDAAGLEKIACTAQGKFVGMPGLRSKTFTINRERREATNFYVWESEAAARAFFSPALLNQVSAIYGMQPTIEFVNVAALVDNVSR